MMFCYVSGGLSFLQKPGQTRWLSIVVERYSQGCGLQTPLDIVPTPTIIFRQLFEKESSTYTYLLGDPTTKEAVLIDTVKETYMR
jgi:hypothetical protein